MKDSARPEAIPFHIKHIDSYIKGEQARYFEARLPARERPQNALIEVHQLPDGTMDVQLHILDSAQAPGFSCGGFTGRVRTDSEG